MKVTEKTVTYVNSCLISGLVHLGSWDGPFLVVGVSGDYFHFYFVFMTSK